jgi:hypothetical protein
MMIRGPNKKNGERESLNTKEVKEVENRAKDEEI